LTAAVLGAGAKKPVEVSKEPAGYYGSDKSAIISAVMYAQAALKKMSVSQVESQGTTPCGPILCASEDSRYFKQVQLRCFKEQVDELRSEGAYAPIFFTSSQEGQVG